MEYEDTRTSGHEKPFYERLQKLYVTAVAMNLLQLTDALDEVDAGDSRGLKDILGKFLTGKFQKLRIFKGEWLL